jgi:ribulose 1,5-bisphosphate synthetase/thiazole synthase
MQIRYHASRVPRMAAADVVVVGGTLAGIVAALTFAQAGRQVILVEPRTYLGRDITATLRPWLPVPSTSMPVHWPPILAACIAESGTSALGQEIPLHLDAVKICLEDLLLTAGVRLIYASLPVALLAGDQGCRGLIIGNKSGRQLLGCEHIVDASETAIVARLAHAEFEYEPVKDDIVYRTLEFTGVGSVESTTLSVPVELGVLNHQLTLHPGYRGGDHWLVECGLRLQVGDTSPGEPAAASNKESISDVFASTDRDIAARRLATDVAAYLLKEVGIFSKAFLASSSYEVHGRYTTRMAGPVPAWAAPLLVAMLAPDAQTALAAFAGPVPGTWCLNEAARADDATAAALRDPVAACNLGTVFAQALIQHWSLAPGLAQPAGEQLPPADQNQPDSSFVVRESKQPQRGKRYTWCEAPALTLATVKQSEVLVVGGGTSGATAAMTAAAQGVHTVLVEMNPGLGGTGTYGGIHTYWFGRRVGFAADVMALVDQMHDHLGHDRQSGPLPTWNIEAKIEALLRANLASGVEIALNTLVIGTIVEETVEETLEETAAGLAVRGIVAATRYGPVALLGQVVIDASGDGDVAAFAGADYVYGAERDHSLMYTYMAQVAQPGRPRNVKTSMIDVTNIEDYTRAIIDERRRRKERDHDHGIYMAPRESRHIKANTVLSLTDQLIKRCWPDVVNIAFSNNDIKGQSTSDWVMLGLISPNLEIEIPYHVLLPKGLEQIIIAGKAFSATHDALAAPRMQPDIENLGGVAALAAVQAVRGGMSPRTIDVRALQVQLVEAGVLPESVLTRTLVPLHFTEAELVALIDQLDAERPLHTYSDMELNQVFRERIPLVDLLCAGPQVIPPLERALKEAQGPRQLLLAEALAMVGSSTGVPVMIEAIQSQLTAPTLPKRTARIRHAGFPPDQNAAPDIAYILHPLGLTCDRRALSIWQQIVDRLATVSVDEIVDKEFSTYYYVAEVCFGAERLGDPAAIPLLKQLHSYAPFHQHVHTAGMQADYLQERIAYLELIIGRALARCGSPDGFVILINYLRDLRAIMAEHAHTELVAITGQDYGKDPAAWGEWLEQQGDMLQPRPWLQPTDPVQAWEEVIYTTAV